MDPAPLDDPIGTSLRGPHSRFAHVDSSVGDFERGRAARYPADVAPFGSVGLDPTSADWAALARLAADAPVALFVDPGLVVPADWTRHAEILLTQLTDDEVDVAVDVAVDGAQDPTALTSVDVPEMLRLTGETAPGPFEPRTVELGGYVGFFDSERLVAMAGRRLNPPGWVEVSAVCTAPEARGRGYARRLITEVARGVRAGGDRAFLHVAEGNPARGLYESMGFVVRRDLKVVVLSPR